MKMKTENPAWDAGPREVARGRCPEDGTGWGGGPRLQAWEPSLRGKQDTQTEEPPPRGRGTGSPRHQVRADPTGGRVQAGAGPPGHTGVGCARAHTPTPTYIR